MDALEELKKRHEEEERQKENAAEMARTEKENEFVRVRQEIVSEIEKFNKLTKDDYRLSGMYNAIATNEDGIYIATEEQSARFQALSRERTERLVNHHELATAEQDAERDELKNTMYYPSMSMLIRKGRFDEEAWLTIVVNGRLPENYKNWYGLLVENNYELAKQLIQAVKDSKKRIDGNEEKKRKAESKRNKIIKAAVSLPVSVFFFYNIFVLHNISLVIGSVICVAIIAAMSGIHAFYAGLGGAIEGIIKMFSMAFAGAIGGLIVGGVAYLLSAIAIPAVVTVLWTIVIIIACSIVIFVEY
jgi:hypothetical protein